MDVPQADPAAASSLQGRAGTPARREPFSVPDSPGSSGAAGPSLRTAEAAGPAAAAHTCRSRSRPLFAAALPRLPLPRTAPETDDIGFRKKLQRVTESSAAPGPKAGTKVQDDFAAASCERLRLHKTCEPEPPSAQNLLLVFGLSTPMASDH
ncbi:unnamed protein product [Coccothraustes coccothraustes]